MYKKIITILFILSFPFLGYSQISLNVLSKMQKEYDFATKSVIQRLIATQQPKINDGIISEFEAKCISINIVDMLGRDNADRFTRISEYSFEGQEPSVVDQNFMEEISKRYLNFMRIIVAECSDAEKAINDAKKTNSNRKENERNDEQ